MLVPENVKKKIDSIGRIVIPKGLRDRMELGDGAELEFYTAKIDGRNVICLAAPVNEQEELERAIELLVSRGYSVEVADDRK